MMEEFHRIRRAIRNIEAFMKDAARHGGQAPPRGKAASA